MKIPHQNDAPTGKFCWICQVRPATTSEHRLKRTDLKRLYESEPFEGAARPFHFRGTIVSRLQSSNAKAVKYRKNLCGECNSAKSQPFDQAYEQFIDWVLQNEQEVLAKKAIDFASIYGVRDYKLRQLNLFKYFAKCFGCRLDEAQRVVPDDVRDLLDQQTFRTGLRITFSIEREVSFDGTNIRLANTVGTFPLFEFRPTDTEHGIFGYSCGQYMSWLAVHFWYCLEPQKELGEVWVADRRQLRLGTSLISPSA